MASLQKRDYGWVCLSSHAILVSSLEKLEATTRTIFNQQTQNSYFGFFEIGLVTNCFPGLAVERVEWSPHYEKEVGSNSPPVDYFFRRI